jgi:DNA-binding response OmpR family regulator
MHVTIVTPYLLQGSLLVNALKRENIHSTTCSPQNSEYFQKDTDAVIFPHPMKEGMWEQVKKLLKDVRLRTPIILIGEVHMSVFKKRGFQKYIRRSIFLNDSIPTAEMPEFIKEIIKKNKVAQKKLFQVGKLTLDRKLRQISWRRKASYLTKKEYFMLELLMLNAGQITTRESIMDYVWDKRSFIAQNTIDVYISRLRKKLQIKPGRPMIETVPCLGYRLVV